MTRPPGASFAQFFPTAPKVKAQSQTRPDLNRDREQSKPGSTPASMTGACDPTTTSAASDAAANAGQNGTVSSPKTQNHHSQTFPALSTRPAHTVARPHQYLAQPPATVPRQLQLRPVFPPRALLPSLPKILPTHWLRPPQSQTCLHV
ncbi:hypothetical protein LB505_004055 [Fusarium chuoi]|nr:hypothetical protein LB505_004055 [Fusarium chuoi]